MLSADRCYELASPVVLLPSQANRMRKFHFFLHYVICVLGLGLVNQSFGEYFRIGFPPRWDIPPSQGIEAFG